MSKYYYFEARGTGTNPDLGAADKRENWKLGFKMGFNGQLSHVFIQELAKKGINIRKNPKNPMYYLEEDMKIVAPDEWDCPDLGKMKPNCLGSSVGMMEFYAKMRPAMEKWFVEKENPDGSPEMIMSTGNEGLGIYGCLYELKPGKMKFKVTENPKKEKKKLFKW
ncbi:MAG: hypothetical protein IKG08_07750 [Eubacterium sp.]|nr:hypothetical protein [Eubacterium sp.]